MVIPVLILFPKFLDVPELSKILYTCTQLRNCDEEINEVEVKPDGSWRTKSEGESKAFGQWHLPDGSLQVFTHNEPKPDSSDLPQQSNKEATGIRLGIRKNHNGLWEVSKPAVSSSGNNPTNTFDPKREKPAPWSQSASVSFGDGDDSSVNEEGRRHFGFSVNGQDLDPMNLSIYSPAPAQSEDVIVLSDSEEDNLGMPWLSNHGMLPEAVDRIPFAETDDGGHDPLVDNGPGSSNVGLFGGGDDFGIPLWPQPGSGFQLFNSEANIQENNSLVCSQVNGFDSADVPVPVTEDFPTTHPNTHEHHQHDSLNQSRIALSRAEVNGSQVNNPLGFAGDDPSLQIFLPVTESAGMIQPELTQEVDLGNGIPTDDWISLRLGGDDGDHHAQASRHQFGSSDGRKDSLADTGNFFFL